MKRYLAIVCAAMLCMCCLVLAACGGSASGSAASSTSSSAAASSTSASAAASSASVASADGASAEASSNASADAADPAEKFIGKWMIAAAVFQGITATGDFSALLGSEANMSMDIQAGGKCVANFEDEETEMAWKLKDDNTISIEWRDSDTLKDIKYEDGVLSLDLSDDSVEGIVKFTKDGTYAGARDISSSKAVNFTSEDEIVGEWTLSGMGMSGVSMFGDPEMLAKFSGEVTETKVVFEKDGTATLFGEKATWAVGADGATTTMADAAIPLKNLDGDLLIDVSSAVPGVDLVFLLSK